mmetsp:Transcript_62495/g.174197  ORF Transcript_62495/g.174197 Transcript_62495/m.174197 type:complete len:263 (-) Transcript_62495:965-1753(-)
MASFNAARVWWAIPKSRAFRAWPAAGNGNGDRSFKRASSSKKRTSTHEPSTTCSRRVAKRSTEPRTFRTASFSSCSGQHSHRSSSTDNSWTYRRMSWEVGSSSVAEASPAPPAAAMAPWAPTPNRSPTALRDAKSRSGNIISTGSVTRRIDSCRNSERRSPTAAHNASRSAPRNACPRPRLIMFTLSAASNNAFNTLGKSAIMAFRAVRSLESFENFVFRQPVASHQKCPTSEATPSPSSNAVENVRCVNGSVFPRISSSSR